MDVSDPISVVIPTLNEAEQLPETVAALRHVPEIQEIIVVDGGSDDATADKAGQLGCRVITAPASRGGQMRRGSQAAGEPIVLFLHADTWLPPHAGRAMTACLQDPTVVGGGFRKRFRDGSWLMAGSRLRCVLRLYLSGQIYGDQGLFVRRETLDQVGGMPAIPLMEEHELCRRLLQVGRLKLAPATVTVSARRFHRLGILRTYWRMVRITWSYHRGTPPEKLARLYNRGK